MNTFCKSLLVAAALIVVGQFGLGAKTALAFGPGGVTSLDGGTGFFNTGVDASGAALASGTDLHYTLSPSGAVVIPTAGVPALVDNATYLTPSNWVAVNATGASDPLGSYVYQTTFTVPASGLDLSTISLYGQIAGNTAITNVILNGNTVTLDPSAAALSAHTTETYDRLYLPSADFITGSNTLQITVANNATHTPSALQIQATVNSLPTIATLTALIPPGGVAFTNTGVGGLYNSGQNATGSALQTQGLGDAHWTIQTNPEAIAPGTAPKVTMSSSFQFGPSGWVPENATSQWISPLATYGVTPSAGLTDLPGNYTFRESFDLTGLDPTTAFLVGRFAIDDHLVEVDLNGVKTAIVGDNLLSHSIYDHYDYFQLTSGFIAGINTLDFILHNNDNSAITGNNVGNPVGINVQFAGVADPLQTPPSVPLPAAVVLFPAGLAVAGLCKRRLGRKA